ncbi:MAG: CHAT domain-containing protein [Halobacteriaceae archaeon]
MSRWTATDGALRVCRGDECVLSVPATGPAAPSPVEHVEDATHPTVRTRFAGLSLPRGPTAVRDATTGATTDLPAGSNLALSDPKADDTAAETAREGWGGAHVVAVDVGALDAASPGALLVARIQGAASLEHERGSRTDLALDGRGSVTLTFRAGWDGPLAPPPTPAGAAAAVTEAARHHPTATAARSLPALRAGVPNIVLGDGETADGAPARRDSAAAADAGLAGPAGGDAAMDGGEAGALAGPTSDGDGGAVTEVLRGPVAAGGVGRSGSSLTLTVPPSFEAVYAVASLAYYLGARVTCEVDAEPALSTPDGTVALAVGDDADGGREPSSLLERVVWLDALVREAGGATAPPETGLLGDLGLSPSLRDEPTAARLERYLAVPFERVADRLPEWHVATYVAPRAGSMPALTGVLSRVSHVHPPVSHELTGRELMERTLDDFYRSDGPPGTRARTPVDVVRPELRRAQLHGWAADGTPLDVYKLVPGASDPDGSNRDRETCERYVTVVHNEAEMRAEGVDAAAAYRDAGGTVVRSVADLTASELREEFQRAPDLLHFVGHCDEAGLRCTDGHLPASSLDGVDVGAVFLNACGSYHEGLALVEGGARAAGVTFRKVLDGQARTVGTTFARLVAAGFPFDRAVELARRRIVMGKDYAVVGDGTHTLFPAEHHCPTVFSVAAAGERPGPDGDPQPAWEVRCEGAGVPGVAGTYHPPHHDDGARRFRGAPAPRTMGQDGLDRLLGDADRPVRHDEGFAWSDEFRTRLADGGHR